MLKKILLFILIAFATPVWAQLDSLTVNGVLSDTSKTPFEKVYISFTDYAGKQAHYTTSAINGRFSVRVPKQPLSTVAVFQVVRPPRSTPKSPLNLFIQNENIQIQGDANQLDLAVVAGGIENEQYNQLRQAGREETLAKDALYAQIANGQVEYKSAEGKAIMDRVLEFSRSESERQKQFIQDHPESLVSLFLLRRLKARYTADAYAATFARLNPLYKDTQMAQDIAAEIEKERITAKGKPIIDFARTTADGKPFRLSDLKGKVVLLDFWGSWCGPCRASMPHLKELYDRYKDKGFEIVGIAQERGATLEASDASWKKAIDELGIDWVHVLNNEDREQMDIVKAYHISGFPTKILVDAEGNFLMRLLASATDDIDIALKQIYDINSP